MNSEYLVNGGGKTQFSFLKLRSMHSLYWVLWLLYAHILNTQIVHNVVWCISALQTAHPFASGAN